MRWLYSLIIQFYGVLICLGSLFNAKAKKWRNGRKDIFLHLKQTIHKDDEIVWFHVASLGEFEQGRPIIEPFRKHFPQYKILLTFFSPSGYEVRKNYEYADYVFYLPLDSRKNAKTFINIVKPTYAFFVKYEFWFNYLNELKKQQIPTYIFSAIFRPSQIFFKPYGKWFLNHLKIFNCIFVQNEESHQLLTKKSIANVVVAGDTRFDRVAEIASASQSFPIIEKFKGNTPLILLGSSWPEEEKMIAKYINNSQIDSRIIIAPHDISFQHIESIKELFDNNVLLYSEATEDIIESRKILVIDSIGILSKLYRYADIAFIGGGFGKGIHNTLEALTFGVPVFFGPNYHKFQEAKEIIITGGGKVIHNSSQLTKELDLLLGDSDRLDITKRICREYIEKKQGAANTIMNYIFQKVK